MKRWEVLIIDDSARFALHVWRFLTSNLGFGIGEVGVDGFCRKSSGKQAWISNAQPLLSEDGCLRLWWISADEQAKDYLERIFSDFEEQSRFYALVDVHGKPGYSATHVRRWLEQKGRGNCSIRLVSAYHTMHHLSSQGDPMPVLPKSRDTLRLITHDLVKRPEKLFSPSEARHILVTGAGFEIRSERGGLGMPMTADVFKEMSPYLKEMTNLTLATSEETSASPFLTPVDGIWEKLALRKRLADFAAKGGLDAYWDFFLKEECQGLLDEIEVLSAENRDKVKSGVLWRERCLREAFRQSLLHHDWGFMNQSLNAAQLPLHAWLTTNYTQFADRAISIYSKAPSNLGGWRIIATAAEARTLIRERASTLNQKIRYLFKLHGDISHLETMAIAGHDKDTFSPLSMPIEDLYQVYAAAETFLRESLRDKPGMIVWHIVGHGLQDRRLCELLTNVWRYTTEAEHVFVVVNRSPTEPCDVLKEALRKQGRPVKRAPVECTLEAAKYMSRLFLMLSESHGTIEGSQDFLQWLEGCKPGKFSYRNGLAHLRR